VPQDSETKRCPCSARGLTCQIVGVMPGDS
jgi:hypothetical protein